MQPLRPQVELRIDDSPRRPSRSAPIGRQLVRILNSITWRPWLARYLIRLIRRTIAFWGSSSVAYRWWIQKYDVVSPQLHAKMAGDIATWPSRPLISVVMPVYNTELRWLHAAIESVRSQIYPDWELCISDDASTSQGVREELLKYAELDRRIKVFFRDINGHIAANSNSALALATGEFIALLDSDDMLPIDALYWVAREVAIHPEVDLLFSDEDKIDRKGKRFEPYFKPAWNPALMLSQNAFSHLGIYRRSLVAQVGGFRVGFEGSQDHDLVLRCAEKTTSDRIRHIPRVLYHWRAISGSTATSAGAKPYAWNAGARAIEDYLSRKGISGKVTHGYGSFYQVNYQSVTDQPRVSILMPSARIEALRPCMSALLERSTYANFEVLLAVNEIELRNFSRTAYLRELKRDSRIRVLVYPDRDFNFSWINNWTARHAEGALLCLMNDDVEVITRDWLERLVAMVMLDGVGATGPMLYYPSNTIQHAGVVLGVGGVADHVSKMRRRGYAEHFGRGALEQDYSCLTAACLLVRRTIFEEVGGFDETLPVAFNDVDLCIRVRCTGARIVWTPTVEMYHHESFTLGRHDSARRREQFRQEVQRIHARWKDVLENDPCYNPNLSLVGGSMFSLAWPPRVPDPAKVVSAATRTSISRTGDLMPENSQAKPETDK